MTLIQRLLLELQKQWEILFSRDTEASTSSLYRDSSRPCTLSSRVIPSSLTLLCSDWHPYQRDNASYSSNCYISEGTVHKPVITGSASVYHSLFNTSRVSPELQRTEGKDDFEVRANVNGSPCHCSTILTVTLTEKL